jgi:hypothetical protein
MIDTIAATAAAGDATTIIGHRRVTKFQRIPVVNKKEEPESSSFFHLVCRPGSALTARMFHERRAPQKRCVQFWCSSKPGGVMIPPEPDELTIRLYSSDMRNASKERANGSFPQRTPTF